MIKGYYFITDAKLSRSGNISDVQSALEAKVGAVQYREKDKDTARLFKEALEIRKLCKDTLFIVNDRVDIAWAVDADGVHLGQDDLALEIARKLLGKKKIIGLTVHSLEQAKNALKLGADYLAVSPVFATTTKLDTGRPTGISLIRQIKLKIALPLVAIGGITILNAAEVIRAGADSLCAISSVVTQPDVKMAIESFQVLFRSSLTYK